MFELEDDIKRLYGIKLSKYIKNGIEVSDELDSVLYVEAIREIVALNYINERTWLNGIIKNKLWKW